MLEIDTLAYETPNELVLFLIELYTSFVSLDRRV